MQEHIKNNPISGNPNRSIMQVRDEVIRLQNEAAKDPHHPSNDGLWAYFEETKRKLEQLKKEQNNHE